MVKEKYNLMVVAHPDDETIFFGGLLQLRRARPWKIICVTDGNADGQGAKRFRQFKKACGRYGAECEWWKFPDVFEKRLPVAELVKRLQALDVPHEIFTHGPIGEYEHPHHQDVSMAVHTAFKGHPRLYSVAHNSLPELRVNLSKKEFTFKTEILTGIYGSETMRFLNLLPASHTEGFVRVSFAEAEAIYAFFSSNKPPAQRRLNKKALKVYEWMVPYLKARTHIKRPF